MYIVTHISENFCADSSFICAGDGRSISTNFAFDTYYCIVINTSDLTRNYDHFEQGHFRINYYEGILCIGAY